MLLLLYLVQCFFILLISVAADTVTPRKAIDTETLESYSFSPSIVLEQSSLLSSIVTSSSPSSISPFTPSGSVRPSTESTTTNHPSAKTSQVPSIEPTVDPTNEPTEEPTMDPTSSSPTFPVTNVPSSKLPTKAPSRSPTKTPSKVPTAEPTVEPSEIPTLEPSNSCICRYNKCDPYSSTNQCCPGLTCQSSWSFSSCQEDPRYLTASPTPFKNGYINQCIMTDSGYGCWSNIPCCNPGTVCNMVTRTCNFYCPTAPTISPRPSKAPVNLPTLKPTKKPSAYPSIVPSKPSNAPTASPSFLPSAEPSTEPTLSPTSAAPVYSPTKVPTFTVSSSPTKEPSISPSGPSPSPTTLPTIFHSQSPSLLPSKAPTAAPKVPSTAKPSVIPPTVASSRTPTFVPSLQHTTKISFDSSIDLQSIQINQTIGHIDDVSLSFISICVDTSMGLPIASSVLTAITPISNRRLQSSGEDNNQPTLVSYRGYFKTSVPLESYPAYQQQPIALFATLSKKLSTAVNTGGFTRSLQKMSQQYNAPSIARAVASNSTFHNVEVVYPPTPSPTGSPVSINNVVRLGALETTGVIIGAAMAAFFFLLIIHAFVRYLGQKNKTMHFASICAAHCSCCPALRSSSTNKDTRISSISSDMDKWVRGVGDSRRTLHAKSSFLLSINRMRNNKLKAAGSNPMALTPKRDQPSDSAGAPVVSDSASHSGTPEAFQLNDAELDKWLQEIQDQDEEEKESNGGGDGGGEVKQHTPVQSNNATAQKSQASPKPAAGKPPLPHPTTTTVALPESMDSLDDESISASTLSRGTNKYEYFLDAAKHSYG